MSNLHLFLVFVMLVAFSATSCTCGELSKAETAGGRPVMDSLLVCLSAPGGIRAMDLFVFRDTLTFPLESHLRLEAPVQEQAALPSTPGDRIAVAIANSPAPFNLEVLRSLENAEQLEMLYRDEDPSFPLMTGLAAACGTAASIELTPLLCPVNIASIQNNTGKFLSQVRLGLEGVNSRAQMLRWDGFSITSTEDSPAALAHPGMMQGKAEFNIGAEPFLPGLTFWCYPFDAGGPSGTSLRVEALAQGAPRAWTFRLPSIGRGGNCELHISLDN